MKFVYRFHALVLLAVLGIASQTHANDRQIGVSRVVSPSVDGQRAITARFRAPTGVQLDQRPLNQSPRRGKSRITLHYTVGNENFRVQRRVVPTLSGSGRNRTLTAVLPQGPGISFPPRAPVVHLNSAYLERPVKANFGARVSFRWVLETPDGVRRGTVHNFVMPHPLTIAIMGDSYGSGEGAPHTAENLINGSVDIDTVTWDDRESHRSKFSGLVLGLNAFANRYPELWIESTHVAVSGATVSTHEVGHKGGYVDDFLGNREAIMIAPHALPNVRVPAQIDRVTAWMGENGFIRMHSILMTGGGNDAGFGDLIQSSVLGDLALFFEQKREQFRRDLNSFELEAKQGFVQALARDIQPRQLLWVNYPDMTWDQRQRPSGFDLEVSLNPALMLLTQAVGGDDMQKARILLREDLNPRLASVCRDIHRSANDIACQIVNVQDEFRGHGINANRANRWFNTFIDAQDRVQGSLDGAVHPNREGYRAYKAPVMASLEGLFHPTRGSESIKLKREARNAARASAKARAKRKALEQARSRALAKRSKQLKAIINNPPCLPQDRLRMVQAERKAPQLTRLPNQSEINRVQALLRSAKGETAARNYRRFIDQQRSKTTRTKQKVAVKRPAKRI